LIEKTTIDKEKDICPKFRALAKLRRRKRLLMDLSEKKDTDGVLSARTTNFVPTL
jgi:hypothetical protein